MEAQPIVFRYHQGAVSPGYEKENISEQSAKR